jgi:hypothetical protein
MRRWPAHLGPSERNWDGLSTRKGFTYAIQANGSLAKNGRSGRHAPGVNPAVNLNEPNRPSFVRAAIIAAAATSPAPIPPTFAGPSATAASEASYNGSSTDSWPGTMLTSTRYAAVAAAASIESHGCAAGSTRYGR